MPWLVYSPGGGAWYALDQSWLDGNRSTEITSKDETIRNEEISDLQSGPKVS